MSPCRYLLLFFCWAAFSFKLSAQELNQTSWKTYYPSMKDTLTLSFINDSLRVSSSTGATVLLSTYKIKDKLIILHDVDGINGCPDLPGSYHLHFDKNKLDFLMAEDPCDGRGGTLISKDWIRSGPVGIPIATLGN